jgi:hypothetical protein
MIVISTDVCFFQIVFISIVASIIFGGAIQFKKDKAESEHASHKSEALDILKNKKVMSK